MKLWTIQNQCVYEDFKDKGILRADETFVCEDMAFHYNWMVEQMKNRIGVSISEKIKYPIWAWYQWRGNDNRRPDLRYSGHLIKGTKGILLELEIERENTLLSDFDEFNNVLNYGYIADNEEEYDKFYIELESQRYCHYDLQTEDIKSDVLYEFKLRLHRSWEKIFDLEREADEKWAGKKDEQAIQATMWEVKWEQVVSVKHFIAK